MAGTSLKTIIRFTPPLNHHHHHHERRHSALLPAGTATCQFGSIRFRKQLHHLRLTVRASMPRSNAAVGYGYATGFTGTTFYDLLQVSKQVSFEEIKKAYRRLALRYHPDVSPPDLVEENARRFMDVQEAYQTLSDPRRREVYDSGLRLGIGSATTSGKWRFNEELYDRSSWKRQWEDQVEKLKKRSMSRDYSYYSDLNSNLSWGARMRRQRWAESTVL